MADGATADRATATRRDTGTRLLALAAVVGLVHAAFTLYWVFGGRWLLRTVGAWAVQLADDRPVVTALVLGVVAVLKIAGALLPALAEARVVPGRRLWRVLGWTGAAGLIAYGLLNVVVAWSVLTGLVSTPGGYDPPAEFGHAALWDPLFLLWGLLLAGGLALTRGGARRVARERSAA